jgi:hypothetical protein
MPFRFNPLTGALDYYSNPVQVPSDPIVSNGLTITGNTITLALATETTAGAISSEDYTLFKNKKEYIPISQTIILTTQNVAEKKITLSNIPSFPESTMLTLQGGALQRYGIEFVVVGQELIWNGLSLDGFLEVDETLLVYYQTE